MTDLESEEIIEGPKVSIAFEFGGTAERPRTRDKYWYRAMLPENPFEPLTIKVARRPRTRRGEDPHPTLRILRPNPNGMLYAKVRSGEIRLETYQDYVNRHILQARDELKNQGGK